MYLLTAITVLTACSFVFFYCSPFRAGLEPRASHMQGRAPLVGYILKPLFCSSSLKLRWLRSAETQAYTSHIQHSIPYPGGVFLVLKLMSKMFKKEKNSCLGVPVLQLPVVPGSWVPLLVVTQLVLTCLTLVLSYFKNVELNQIPAFLSYNIWIALVKAMKKIILWWSLEILVAVSKFHNLFPVHIVMNSHYCLQSVE